MADDAAFLRAILAQPEADLPRLIYADYLDERGEGDTALGCRIMSVFGVSPQRRDNDSWEPSPTGEWWQWYNGGLLVPSPYPPTMARAILPGRILDPLRVGRWRCQSFVEAATVLGRAIRQTWEHQGQPDADCVAWATAEAKRLGLGVYGDDSRPDLPLAAENLRTVAVHGDPL